MTKVVTGIAFIACLLSSTALFAQLEPTEVLGTIHDPSGSPIPNATVTLESQDTGIKLKTATNT
ncbi:MAG TPA: carboxypeptidase-like regulatory domain-containing protein, partial [Blastocatellia bacterium]|nr:carboxypeptidase-like regulatory domain-containing protein [Blastocatellia bacterium]